MLSIFDQALSYCYCLQCMKSALFLPVLMSDVFTVLIRIVKKFVCAESHKNK